MRIELAKILLARPDIFLLDEPTNHLDIESKEVFEEALLDFPGTCIIVSHDRYFLNRIPTRIMELTADGMENYLGAYDYYVEKKQQIESGKKYLNELGAKASTGDAKGTLTGSKGTASDLNASAGEEMSSAEKRKLQKEKEAEERRIKRQKEALEKDIATLEEDIAILEAEVCKVEIATDHVKLAKISTDLAQKREVLEEKYDQWLELQC